MIELVYILLLVLIITFIEVPLLVMFFTKKGWWKRNWKKIVTVASIITIGSASISLLPVGGPVDDPPDDEPYLYEYIVPPVDSFGIGETIFKTVNWSYFWQLFLAHSAWQLEAWHPILEEWVTEFQGENLNNWLDINRIRSEDNTSEKITLKVTNNAPIDTYFRFTFGIDIAVKNYVNKTSLYEYEITYPANATEDYNVLFNFSDVKPLIQDGVILANHGIKNINGNDVFWFRLTQNMSRNPLQSGNSFEIDPEFGYNGGAYGWYSPINIREFACKDTPASDGVAKTIHAYLYSSANINVKCALYDYDTLAFIETTEEKVINQDWGWVSFTLDEDVDVYDDTEYMVVCFGSGENVGRIGYTVEGDDKWFAQDYQTYPTWSNPYTKNAENTNWEYLLYCTYIVNAAPDGVSGECPTNGSIGISLNPTLYGIVTDPNGDSMDVTWWSNSSGSWVQFASNTSVANNTNISQPTSNFSSYNTKYWWSMNVSDGEGGWCNSTFHFTTLSVYKSTIRTDGIDYFIWLGDDDEDASGVADIIDDEGITWSDGEYIASWTATSWGDDGLWQTYYPHDESGTNFNIDTFMVIKVYITDDVGDIEIDMPEDSGTTYSDAREVTLTFGVNNGGNYVGWTDDESTTASDMATSDISTTLDDNEQIWYWNETNYEWEYYIVGFMEPSITISEDDVVFIRVEDQETLDIGGK